MKTAIFRKFIQLLLLALLLNTAILYIVTGSVILNNSRNDMVFILDTIDSAFHYEGDLAFEIHRYTEHTPDELVPGAIRYSIEVGNYLLKLAQDEE